MNQKPVAGTYVIPASFCINCSVEIRGGNFCGLCAYPVQYYQVDSISQPDAFAKAENEDEKNQDEIEEAIDQKILSEMLEDGSMDSLIALDEEIYEEEMNTYLERINNTPHVGEDEPETGSIFIFTEPKKVSVKKVSKKKKAKKRPSSLIVPQNASPEIKHIEPLTWECPMCNYANETTLSDCEICQTKATKTTVPKSSYAEVVHSSPQYSTVSSVYVPPVEKKMSLVEFLQELMLCFVIFVCKNKKLGLPEGFKPSETTFNDWIQFMKKSKNKLMTTVLVKFQNAEMCRRVLTNEVSWEKAFGSQPQHGGMEGTYATALWYILTAIGAAQTSCKKPYLTATVRSSSLKGSILEDGRDFFFDIENTDTLTPQNLFESSYGIVVQSVPRANQLLVLLSVWRDSVLTINKLDVEHVLDVTRLYQEALDKKYTTMEDFFLSNSHMLV